MTITSTYAGQHPLWLACASEKAVSILAVWVQNAVEVQAAVLYVSLKISNVQCSSPFRTPRIQLLLLVRSSP